MHEDLGGDIDALEYISDRLHRTAQLMRCPNTAEITVRAVQVSTHPPHHSQ